jgi:hypothetical protein
MMAAGLDKLSYVFLHWVKMATGIAILLVAILLVAIRLVSLLLVSVLFVSLLLISLLLVALPLVAVLVVHAFSHRSITVVETSFRNQRQDVYSISRR